MTTAADNPTTPDREAERFVLLVDAAPLEPMLRRVPHCRVTAAADFHDAIGELHAWLVRTGSSDAPQPVVIAPRSRLDDGEPNRITQALRRVHHDVRIIALSNGADTSDDTSVVPEDIEAVIDPSITQDALAELLDRPPASPPPQPDQPEPGAGESRSREREDDAATTMIDGLGDEGLLGLMMTDPRCVPDAALKLLRRRTGIDDLRFLTSVDAAPDELCRTVVDVVHQGRAVGQLVTDHDAQRVLIPWSSWLARWIVAAEQMLDLRTDAFTDELTGAWNRRYFVRFMDRAIVEAGEYRRALTVMLLDVDDLKTYNDAYGHAAGDDVLVETVRLLKSVIRPGDRVCRIGGDEFAVVFYDPQGPRTPTSQHPRTVELIAARFQEQIARCRFPKLGDDAPGPLTISGGLATYPWDGLDTESLVRRADDRAMQAKRRGKNAIVFGPQHT
ncbi:MAG: GGDEF domain-containing protein [Phycisphaerales bacterium]|nr:GGDEF domain-containing protein [Phycisphaerales bacterium]